MCRAELAGRNEGRQRRLRGEGGYSFLQLGLLINSLSASWRGGEETGSRGQACPPAQHWTGRGNCGYCVPQVSVTMDSAVLLIGLRIFRVPSSQRSSIYFSPYSIFFVYIIINIMYYIIIIIYALYFL